MSTDWQQTIAAWSLAEAGQWEAAMNAAQNDPALLSVLSLRKGQFMDGVGPAILGWQLYYQGKYRDALQEFITGVDQENDGWLKAWAQLGIAKVASDSGWWGLAVDWCAVAWRTASKNEHLDLMAQVAGARGEALLRAGCPGDAATSFAEDKALLGPGNRYSGRLRCYQAHAWSRLGPNGEKAATLAYRLAMHSVGEGVTSAFAAAGLAILAARNMDPIRFKSIQMEEFSDLPKFWISVAAARLAADPDGRGLYLQSAFDALPSVYFAEHWWLAGWSRALGMPVSVSPVISECFPTHIPEANLGQFTLVESPFSGKNLNDAHWWNESPSECDDEAWWKIRDSFMP